LNNYIKSRHVAGYVLLMDDMKHCVSKELTEGNTARKLITYDKFKHKERGTIIYGTVVRDC
jgi:hypothetical protein